MSILDKIWKELEQEALDVDIYKYWPKETHQVIRRNVEALEAKETIVKEWAAKMIEIVELPCVQSLRGDGRVFWYIIKDVIAAHEKEIADMKNMLIYVREHHLCGTPLIEAIKMYIPDDDKETTITKV